MIEFGHRLNTEDEREGGVKGTLQLTSRRHALKGKHRIAPTVHDSVTPSWSLCWRAVNWTQRELVGVTVRDSHLRGPSEVSHSRKLSAGGEEAPEFFLMQPLLLGSGVFVPIFHFRPLLPPTALF